MKEEILDLGIGDKMKVYVKYNREIDGWRKNQLDTELMLYKGREVLGVGPLLKQVRNLSDLSSIIEENKVIYVLREPMELSGGQITYDSVEYNIDFLINSSTILFVAPNTEDEEVETPPSENALQRLGKYLNEDPKQVCMNCDKTLDDPNGCGSVLHDPYRAKHVIGSTNVNGIVD